MVQSSRGCSLGCQSGGHEFDARHKLDIYTSRCHLVSLTQPPASREYPISASNTRSQSSTIPHQGRSAPINMFCGMVVVCCLHVRHCLYAAMPGFCINITTNIRITFLRRQMTHGSFLRAGSILCMFGIPLLLVTWVG